MGQTVHAAPQAVASASEAHFPAQAWNVGLHVTLHTPPAHALIAFATSGQAMSQLPQWFVLVIRSTHSAPHFTGAVGAHPFVHWNVVPLGAQRGAAAPQAPLHAPQVAGFERSLSQPSLAFPLQSA
jgi:hypothetical protein